MGLAGGGNLLQAALTSLRRSRPRAEAPRGGGGAEGGVRLVAAKHDGDWSPTWPTKSAKLAAFSGGEFFCRVAGAMLGPTPLPVTHGPLAAPRRRRSSRPAHKRSFFVLSPPALSLTTPPTSRISSLPSRPRAAGHPYPAPRTIFVPPSCWAPPGCPARRHLQPDPDLPVTAGPDQRGGPSGLTGSPASPLP